MCKVEKGKSQQQVTDDKPIVINNKKEISKMATPKRRFYNFGEAKGFTKAVYYSTIASILSGEEVDDNLRDLCIAATEYELEGVEIKSSQKSQSTPPGERRDPLHSDYANEIRAAILPLITDNPQSAKSLIEQATAAGKVSSKSGKPFGYAWVCRVLNAEAGVAATKVITETVDRAGLMKQVPLTAYSKG